MVQAGLTRTGMAQSAMVQAAMTSAPTTPPNPIAWSVTAIVRPSSVRAAAWTRGPASVTAKTMTMAATAVSAWLGARVFRVHDVAATRQTLDMVASIRGDRPPARTTRGLA